MRFSSIYKPTEHRDVPARQISCSAIRMRIGDRWGHQRTVRERHEVPYFKMKCERAETQQRSSLTHRDGASCCRQKSGLLAVLPPPAPSSPLFVCSSFQPFIQRPSPFKSPSDVRRWRGGGLRVRGVGSFHVSMSFYIKR